MASLWEVNEDELLIEEITVDKEIPCSAAQISSRGSQIKTN